MSGVGQAKMRLKQAIDEYEASRPKGPPEPKYKDSEQDGGGDDLELSESEVK